MFIKHSYPESILYSAPYITTIGRKEAFFVSTDHFPTINQKSTMIWDFQWTTGTARTHFRISSVHASPEEKGVQLKKGHICMLSQGSDIINFETMDTIFFKCA